MQTGRTPPYLTHNRILTWEVADETLPRDSSLSSPLLPTATCTFSHSLSLSPSLFPSSSHFSPRSPRIGFCPARSLGASGRASSAEEGGRWEKYMGDRDPDRAYKTCPRRSRRTSRQRALGSIPKITAIRLIDGLMRERPWKTVRRRVEPRVSRTAGQLSS